MWAIVFVELQVDVIMILTNSLWLLSTQFLLYGVVSGMSGLLFIYYFFFEIMDQQLCWFMISTQA